MVRANNHRACLTQTTNDGCVAACHFTHPVWVIVAKTRREQWKTLDCDVLLDRHGNPVEKPKLFATHNGSLGFLRLLPSALDIKSSKAAQNEFEFFRSGEAVFRHLGGRQLAGSDELSRLPRGSN